MSDYMIITDSSCDIMPDLLAEWEVPFVSLTVKFDEDADIAAGFYYTFKHWNLYVWSNDLLKSHPRMVIGLDVTL